MESHFGTNKNSRPRKRMNQLIYYEDCRAVVMPLVGFNQCISLKIKLRIQLGIIARLKEPSNISLTFKSTTDARQKHGLTILLDSYKPRTISIFYIRRRAVTPIQDKDAAVQRGGLIA